MLDAAQARFNMVENQLRPNKITDERLLAAMGEVPREAFVPPRLSGAAYGDEDLRLDGGKWLPEPLALASLLQAAELAAGDKLLVVGCTTGYAATVASALCGTVVMTVDDRAELDATQIRLDELGVAKVDLAVAEPTQGVKDQAPFDAIVVTGAIEIVPETLLAQLAEGGRLVTVTLGGRAGRLTVFRRISGAIGRTTPADTNMPLLPAFRQPAAFAF
jgi:protein-L-isoaspartate(D-aspartate) O-methyltransferase